MSEVKKETKPKKTSTAKKTTKEIKEETKPKKVSTTKSSTKKVKEELKEEIKETKVVNKTTKTKKEEKKETVLLSDRDQINYKSLSKAVKILAKICKIALMIFVPFIFITMIMVPFAFKNFEINANVIKFDDVNIIVNEEKVTFKIGDSAHVIKCDARALDRITTFLTDNTKGSIITFVELSLFLFAIIMIIDIYILSYLEKLFDNFIKKGTPFIKENTTYIFRIAILICALKFISICLNIANLSMIKPTSYGIIDILVIFTIYIIFKYAVKLQEKNKEKMCD